MNKSRRIVEGFVGVFLLIVASLPAQGQMIGFESTPVSNACAAGWLLIPGPNCPSAPLGQGSATVLTCGMTSMAAITQGGGFNYVPVGDPVIPPGWACFFNGCSTAQITLTCFQIGFENDELKAQDKVVIKMRRGETRRARPKVPAAGNQSGRADGTQAASGRRRSTLSRARKQRLNATVVAATAKSN